MTRKNFALVDEQIIEDTLYLQRGLGAMRLLQPEPLPLPHAQCYGSVLRDNDGQWRMYYLRFVSRDPATNLVSLDIPECLALSRDGLHWEMPHLDLNPYDGEPYDGAELRNLVIGPKQQDATGRYLTGFCGMEGFCVIDNTTHPHPHARGRFTAMSSSFPLDSIGGICLYYSDDGLHWLGYPENPVIVGSSDTQNTFLYDAKIGKYVCYLRPIIGCGAERHANRKIARMESADLVAWSLSRVVLDTDEADASGTEYFEEPGMRGQRGRVTQFQGLTPFLYNDCYLGFAWYYDSRIGTFTQELVRSDDGIAWKREPQREPIVAHQQPPGFEGELPVPVGSPPIAVGDELWFWMSNSGRDHHTVALAVENPDDPNAGNVLEDSVIYSLAIKRDRWVGYTAGEREGELLSTPFAWAGGGPLHLNVDIKEGGEVRVQFEDEWARPIREFHLDEIAPYTGPLDAVDAPLAFGPSMEGHFGPKSILKFPTPGRIRLRIFLRNATLYGWSIEGPGV